MGVPDRWVDRLQVRLFSTPRWVGHLGTETSGRPGSLEHVQMSQMREFSASVLFFAGLGFLERVGSLAEPQ